MTEQWRDVPGYPGYRVSDLGRVHGPRKLLKCNPNNTGYRMAGLSAGYLKAVHLIVLEAFAGPRPAGAVARHLNGDKQDNRLENLVWGTAKENADDMVRHGTANIKATKLTPDDVHAIRRDYRPYSRTHGSTALGKRYGVHSGTITNIINGTSWGHV